jgi:morphogenetic protein associated with SpoVID
VKIHIVQKGDTLWKIAKKYGVNFEELKQMNTQLSNPDMIMPGMKIKVPTTGGTIKKEAPLGTKAKINYGTKKEMPIAQQPLIKEQPKTLPIKEAPMQMPIKEAPIMPVKEAPIMPIKEAPIKEVPIAPYIPQMPQPIIPEIDINNYYMMNMANLSVQQPPAPQLQPQLPPKPVNILPEVKEEPIVESIPESIPAPVQQPIQGGLQQPMCPPFGYPISPVLPGSGLPCPPVPCPPMPCPPGYPGYPMPYQSQVQGGMAQQMPYGMPQQMPYGMPRLEGNNNIMPQMSQMPQMVDESPPIMPQMPYQMPTQTAPIAETQLPMCPPYPQTAPMMQMPYGQMPYCGPLYPISPILPCSVLPYGQNPYGYPQAGEVPQVQGIMDVESPEMMSQQYQMPYQMPQSLPMQQMTPPSVAGTKDCGCGGPKHHQVAPFQQGASYPQGMPFHQEQQYPQGMPFPQGQPYPQGMPFPQGQQYPQGMPFQQDQQYPQGMPFPQGQQYSQGMPFPQGQQYSQGAPLQQGAPSLPPGYGQEMSPYFGQQALGQPPLMNPYGTGQNADAFSMPRYNDESSEYAG